MSERELCPCVAVFQTPGPATALATCIGWHLPSCPVGHATLKPRWLCPYERRVGGVKDRRLQTESPGEALPWPAVV